MTTPKAPTMKADLEQAEVIVAEQLDGVQRAMLSTVVDHGPLNSFMFDVALKQSLGELGLIWFRGGLTAADCEVGPMPLGLRVRSILERKQS